MADITTQSTANSSQPAWYKQLIQQLGQSAATTAGQGYTPYTNSRIAGFTPAQTQAFQQTQSNVGSYKPGFAAAGQDYSGGASTGQLNQPSFNSFMNPYTSDVVDQIATLGNRNLTENVLPGVNSTFTGAGQFGSSRNADFTNRALRDNQTAISQAQGQALAGGFQNQVQNSQNAQAQQLQAGQLQQGLGTATQAAGLTDASALSAIGQQQQNQNQSNENLAYQDFLTQQQWPYQQESYLAGILGGSPVPTQTQQTQTTPGPSTTSQVLGGLAGAAGLLGSTGAFNSVGSGISNFLGGLFADGGEFSDGSDGGTPQGGTGVSGWQSDLAGTPFAKGGAADDGSDSKAVNDRILADRWMQFRGMMGYQQPTGQDDGTFAPIQYAKGGAAHLSLLAGGGAPKAPKVSAPAIRSRRPRFGGTATRRMGGIGMNPGAGTSGILPGAPAGIGGRMPGAMNPGASSIIRGLSGAATPTARIV